MAAPPPTQPTSGPSRVVRAVLVEAMPGVRAGLRWVLAGAPDVTVDGEAATVADALATPGDVLVAGLRFSDGTAADLCAAERPVVVFTWLPDDEHDVDLRRAAAVVGAGALRLRLAAAVSEAARRRTPASPPPPTARPGGSGA